MASQLKGEEPSKPRRPPAKTPEDQEQHMINLAVQEAERQILNKTASSQILVHYVKLASSRERLEQEKMGLEMELLEKKAEALATAARVEDLMKEALAAFRQYSGQEIEQEGEVYHD